MRAHRAAAPRRSTRLLHQLLACAAVLLCATSPSLAVPGASATESLARLEQLARRQPVDALRELVALERAHPALTEHDQLQAELVRVLIADAQYRSDDVLSITDRMHERLVRLDDARIDVQVQRVRASALYDLGRFDDAWNTLQEELRQAERTHDDDEAALALVDSVFYLIRRSEFERAASAVADADRRAHGAAARAEIAYYNGMLDQEIGDWSAAMSAYQTAFERYRELGQLPGQADAQAGMGATLNQLQRPAEALEPLETAVRLYGEIGDEDGAAITMGNQALAHAALGQFNRALDINARAVATLTRINKPVRLASVQVDRAQLLVDLRRCAEALALVERARPVIEAQEDLRLRAHLYEVSASALAGVGRHREAYELMTRHEEAEHKYTTQIVARQLAVQRGRLESDRLSRENALLRDRAETSARALAEANRAHELQNLALLLGGLVVLGALVAIWRQRALVRHIARIAETDALTGMLNRRHVLELGQRMMQRCRRDGEPCAILMLDLDRFKEINDRHGHLAGDRALRAIAGAMTQCLRPGDQIGRYGGEEFAVILPGADAAEAGTVAERLRDAVAHVAPDWAPGAEALTVSGGIAIATGEVADFTELLVRADRALYRAKDAGRNRMEYHTNEAVLTPG